MSGLGRLLPPAGPLRAYSFISLVDALGTGVFVTGSAAFFIFYAGLSPGQVGLGLTVAGLVGLVASVPAGIGGDRFGHRRLLIIINIVRAAAFALYVLISSFPLFLVLVTVIALADAAEPANRRAYLSAISSREERVKANAYNRSVWNLGFAIGSVGAGFVLAADVRFLYAALAIGNALSYVGAAVVLGRLPAVATGPTPAPAGPPVRRRALGNAPFMSVALVAGVLYAHAQLLGVGLPLWVLTRTAAPHWVLAALMLLNTILAISLQVWVSGGSQTPTGAARAGRWAGLALLGGCVLWGLTAQRPVPVTIVLLVAGMVLMTAGELLCSAASWGLSYALAPESAQGEYLGAWSLGVQLVQSLGPIVFAAPLLGFGLTGWLAVGLVFLVAGLAMPAVARRAQRRMDPAGLSGVPAVAT